jgi:PAS domain S-box-containing protein
MPGSPLDPQADLAAANAANQQLGNLLERVSDAFVALDRDWRYTYVNRHGAELFGRRPEDLIGKHIWTEFPEGRGQPFHLAYEKALAEQVFIKMENYYEPWDRWFENRIYPSPDGLSIFFHEITDRKQAEHAAIQNAQLVKEHNRVLERIAQGAPLEETLDSLLRVIEAQCPGMLCSIVLLDPDGIHVRHGAAPSLPDSFVRSLDGESIGPRAGSCGTAAWRREPVLVDDIETDALWDGYRDAALRHGLRACWSTPIFDVQQRVIGTFALYFRARPGSPTARHREIIEMATHTAAIAITKHREVDALRLSEERLRLAVMGGNIGIWEWLVGTNRLFWSDHLYDMFGWPKDARELTLSMFLSSLHADDRLRTEAALSRSLAERAGYDVEYRILHPDGSLHWIAAKGRAEFDAAGRPVRMMGVALDITERKVAEERRRAEELLRAKNEELKSFAYTISHDLKAPLRGIAGYAQELIRQHCDGLSERALFCLKQILTATNNLDRLIEDLLHYSRLDAETPTAIEIDVARVIESVLNDRKPIIAQHGAEVTVTVAPVRIRTWERGFLQVVTNLIDNALKYSRNAGPPRITISIQDLPHALLLAVADNGIGFNMKYHDRIFGLFNRLVRQEEFEGTGAGLAIVKKLVEKLGGRVWGESQPGAGATFFVELPKSPGARNVE